MHTCHKQPRLPVFRWSEQLVVYPRTNKQNQKKKRKVEPTTSQVILLTPVHKSTLHSLSSTDSDGFIFYH